jgi:hypothetical protein
MPQVTIELLAETIADWLAAGTIGDAIATVVATVIVGAVATFALGKISQALSGSQSDVGGPPSQTVTMQGKTESRRGIYGIPGPDWKLACEFD